MITQHVVAQPGRMEHHDGTSDNGPELTDAVLAQITAGGYTGGINVALGDGSVRFVRSTVMVSEFM